MLEFTFYLYNMAATILTGEKKDGGSVYLDDAADATGPQGGLWKIGFCRFAGRSRHVSGGGVDRGLSRFVGRQTAFDGRPLGLS